MCRRPGQYIYITDVSQYVFEIPAGSTTAVQGPALFASDLKCDQAGNWFAIVDFDVIEVPVSDRTQKIPLPQSGSARVIALDQGGNVYYTVHDGTNNSGIYQISSGFPPTKIGGDNNSLFPAVDGLGNLFAYEGNGTIIKGTRRTGFFINSALPFRTSILTGRQV